MSKLQKHPDAIAWDNWLESEEGAGCANHITLGLSDTNRQYLENRLARAFQAGIKFSKTYPPGTRFRCVVCGMVSAGCRWGKTICPRRHFGLDKKLCKGVYLEARLVPPTPDYPRPANRG